MRTVMALYNTGPGEIIPMVADISKKEEVQRISSEVASKEPHGIQLLVNNAGIAKDEETRYETHGQPNLKDAQAISDFFMKSNPQSWADSFQTNVTAQFFMSMAFLPLLASGCDIVPGYTSSIVQISSNSGFLKSNTRGYISYSASKAATTHLARMLATTFSETRVRVNTIAPGTFPTEMTAGSSGPDQKSTLVRAPSNAAGRAGRESDIGATVLLLASIGGSFYNHQTLFPDGGETLVEPAAI